MAHFGCPLVGDSVSELFKPLREKAMLRCGDRFEMERSTAAMALFPPPLFVGELKGINRAPIQLIPALETGGLAVHAVSVANEIACLRNRVLMQVVEPSAAGRHSLVLHQMAVRRMIGEVVGKVEPWTLGRTLRHMVARHGAGLYVPAFETLRTCPLDSRDAKIKMFLKIEKNFVEDELKTPRAIQYRGPRFNLCLAKYLLAFEEKFYTAYSKPNPHRIHTSKGLDPVRRAELMIALWQRQARPAALCMDASRFDAHVTKELLEYEHSCYKQAFGPVRFLEWMLKCQVVNVGKGVLGSSYKLVGGRMSGDVNTALGNTLIQLTVLRSIAVGYDVDILAEGDDAVIFGNVEDIRALAAVVANRSAEVGFNMKSSVAYVIEDLDYCSCRLIEIATGKWTSIRAWPKPLFSDRYTVRQVTSLKAIGEKARTMAVCFMLTYKNQPIYLAWAKYLLSWAPPSRLDPWYDRHYWVETVLKVKDELASEKVVDLYSISDVARASLALAFGIMPCEQLMIEERLCGQRGPHPSEILEGEWSVLRKAALSLRGTGKTAGTPH